MVMIWVHPKPAIDPRTEKAGLWATQPLQVWDAGAATNTCRASGTQGSLHSQKSDKIKLSSTNAVK
jgi:hypothetical protein